MSQLQKEYVILVKGEKKTIVTADLSKSRQKDLQLVDTKTQLVLVTSWAERDAASEEAREFGYRLSKARPAGQYPDRNKVMRTRAATVEGQWLNFSGTGSSIGASFSKKGFQLLRDQFEEICAVHDSMPDIGTPETK